MQAANILTLAVTVQHGLTKTCIGWEHEPQATSPHTRQRPNLIPVLFVTRRETGIWDDAQTQVSPPGAQCKSQLRMCILLFESTTNTLVHRGAF